MPLVHLEWRLQSVKLGRLKSPTPREIETLHYTKKILDKTFE